MPFPKKNASIVWKYFDKDVNKPNVAVCTLCKTSYKRSNSTSNLLDHLNRKHFTVLNRDRMRVNEEREEDENTPGTSEVNTSAVIPRAEIVTTGPIVTRQKQMVLSNRFNHYPTGLDIFGTVSEHQINEFHEAIVRMIAEDLQPLSIVENSSFRRMIKLLDSRYEIPSRRTLGRTIIPQIMEKVKGNVQIVLNAASHIAVTTDIWNFMNTDSFMTLTAHFVNTNLRELSTVVLCTKKLESNHTGVYLSQVMTKELMKWNILNK